MDAFLVTGGIDEMNRWRITILLAISARLDGSESASWLGDYYQNATWTRIGEWVETASSSWGKEVVFSVQGTDNRSIGSRIR